MKGKYHLVLDQNASESPFLKKHWFLECSNNSQKRQRNINPDLQMSWVEDEVET
jgi:hypothetical protein